MNQERNQSPAETYENYLVPGIHARWTPIFLEYARPKPGDQVLDLACGTGIVARNLAPAVGGDGRVVGIDVNPDMLKVARDLPQPDGADIEWREGDAASLPLPDGVFDLATCQQGLQFFDDPSAGLSEMRRVMADDGRAAVSVWHGLSDHPLYEALCTAEAQYLGTSVDAVSTPFSLGDGGELSRLLLEAGFEHVDVSTESHVVEFPSPDRFVTLTLLAAASIIPKSEMDAEARQEMVRTIRGEVENVLREYVTSNTVSFPMHANIAVAYA